MRRELRGTEGKTLFSESEIVEFVCERYRYDHQTCGVVDRTTGFAIVRGSRQGRRSIELPSGWIRRSDAVWMLHYGCHPPGTLTHVNRDLTDDRIENLGCKVTVALGSFIVGHGSEWRVVIHADGSRRYLIRQGPFPSFYTALAVCEALHDHLRVSDLV